MVAQERRPLAPLGDGGAGLDGRDDRGGVGPGEGEEGPLVEQEVEEHRKPVAATEVLEQLLLLDVGLGQQHAVAPPQLGHRPQVVQDREVLLRLGLVRPRHLQHEGRGVHPEPGHAELQPEGDDLHDLVPDRRFGHVEVGLEVVEAVVVPGLGHLVEGPRLLLVAGEHHPLGPVRGFVLRPDVPVPVRRLRVRPGGLEPRVLIGGVVDDQVHDHPQASVPGLVQELGEVAEAADVRVDAVEVGDVVAVVAVGCRVDGVEPDAGDAQAGQVVEPRDQAGQVTDPVAVRVLEGLDVEAVDDGLLVPALAHGRGPTRSGPRPSLSR